MKKYTLAEIGEKINGEVHGPADVIITGTAEIEKAGPTELTFLANPKYRDWLAHSRAAAVIVDERSTPPENRPYIKVDDAYFGFLQALLLFYEPKHLLDAGIHPTAIIHETVRLGKEVKIGANAYLGPGVTVGDRSEIFPNCVLLNDSKVGADSRLYPLVSVREDCIIGDRVIIHNGAVIGSDGFGFAPHGGKFYKIPQVGRVVIEDDVEIGANVTIDRGTLGETRICQGVKIDNLVHIAHNVTVGKHTVMAAQTGISGSTQIGANVMLAGQVGIIGHLRIGNRAQVAAQSGVTKDIPDGETVWGSPARPMAKARRIEVILNTLPELRKQVLELTRQVAKLREKVEDIK